MTASTEAGAPAPRTIAALAAVPTRIGVPRIRKWTWSQIDRLVVDDEDVMLELWDGSYEKLPKVREGKKLAELLERVAAGRGRPVTRLPRKA